MIRRLLYVGVPVLVVLAAFGLYWFAPWRLFTNNTVNEALSVPVAPASAPSAPSASAAVAGPRVVRGGAFVTHEHATSGEVRVVELSDGRRQLEIANLSTSDGPDLRVWLTDQAVVEGSAGWRVFDDGRYVELGKLKGNRGNQVYEIPAGTDLAAFRSVTIWCKRFSVSFGAATLA